MIMLPSENESYTFAKCNLEKLQEEIYIGWLRDLDKTPQLKELIDILSIILKQDTIEQAFENETDFKYFMTSFTKETLDNILGQGQVFGEDGDDIALEVLILYLKIFLKFIDNPKYSPFWESITEIFNSSRSFYFDTGYRVHKITNERKLMTAEKYNQEHLKRKCGIYMQLEEGMSLDVQVTKEFTSENSSEKKIWVRGIVAKVNEDNFLVLTSEDPNPICIKFSSYEYTHKGTMTSNWEWRHELQVDDMIDCFERQKWYPATVMERKDDVINGLANIEYKISFRIYPHLYPNWMDYKHIWPGKELAKDSQERDYLGDGENFDEKIQCHSRRIEPFGKMTDIEHKPIDRFERENYFIDDMVEFIDDKKNRTYVIGRNRHFSYYYSLLVTNFAEGNGFERLIDVISTKPSVEILSVIFRILDATMVFFHKEYVIELSHKLYHNISQYIHTLTNHEIQRLKKESFDLIVAVLRFYLGLSLGIQKRNEEIIVFILAYAQKLININLIEPQTSGVLCILNALSISKDEKCIITMLIDFIHQQNILYELYHKNSHCSVISKTTPLIEIMLKESRLEDQDIEMIWDAAKKSDSNVMLTLLHIFKEICPLLKPSHKHIIQFEIYSRNRLDLLDEEFDLLFELSKDDQEGQLHSLEFFTQCMLEMPHTAGDRIICLMNKICETTTQNPNLKLNVVKIIMDSIDRNHHAINALALLQKYINDSTFQNDIELNDILIANDSLVSHFVGSFLSYLDLSRATEQTVSSVFDTALIDGATHSENLKARIAFLNLLIGINLWTLEIDPLDFVFKHLIECGPISRIDVAEFYNWIKYRLEQAVHDDIAEEKIFKLFTEKICVDSATCTNLPVSAFETFLQVFLLYNTKNSTLKYTPTPAPSDRENEMAIEVYIDPDQLLGFHILWKIIFESKCVDVVNKGANFLVRLFANVRISNPNEMISIHEVPVYSEQLVKRILNLLYDSSSDMSIDNDMRKLIISNCLRTLTLIIEESEKSGTAGVVSHRNILKKKLISFQVNSFVTLLGDNCTNFLVYSNTTVWDLKRIIGIKLNYCADFLKFSMKSLNDKVPFHYKDHGKTVLELGIKNKSELSIHSNGNERDIPQVEFGDPPSPEIMQVLNDWFTQFSSNNEMKREHLAKFIKKVTGSTEEIPVDDVRIVELFRQRDMNNDGIMERQDFLDFYCDSMRDRKRLVWDNIHSMGLRNDLRKFSEPYLKYTEDSTSLPRFILASNECLVGLLFSFTDDNLSTDAFNFLQVLSTSPHIYKQVFNADKSSEWEQLLDSGNTLKLIYVIQIIESIIEDIEVDANQENVDNKLLHCNAVHSLDEKIEWMKRFFMTGGYSLLVSIFLEKVKEWIEDISMPLKFTCLRLLIRLSQKIYTTVLYKMEIYRKAISEYKNEKKLVNVSDSPVEISTTQLLKNLFADENQHLYDFIISSFDSYSIVSLFMNALQVVFIKRKSDEKFTRLLTKIFEFLCVILPNTRDYSQVEENLLISNQTFNETILDMILSDNEHTREEIARSVITMTKLLHFKNSHGWIFCILEKLFHIIDNIAADVKKSYELFDLFANFMEMCTIVYNTDENNNSINTKSSLFLKRILDNLNQDIHDQWSTNSLSNELFLGYIKIISKVCESNQEIKSYISTNYHLIQGILSNVCHHQSLSQIALSLSNLEFVNLDWTLNRRSMRNSSPLLKHVCHRFLLSMLNGSIENFKEYFNMNEEEEGKKENPDNEAKYSYTSNSLKTGRYVGLKNPSNMSYMNSILQQLYMVPSFRYSILRIQDQIEPNIHNSYDIDDNALHQLQRAFAFLELSEREEYNPFGLAFSFKDSNEILNQRDQKDPQEFLTQLFQRIDGHLMQTAGKFLIHSIFGGKTSNQIMCSNCNKISITEDHSYFFSIEVAKIKTLSDSLQKLVSPEKIEDYWCDACHKSMCATKKISLKILPNIFIAHLQRVIYNIEADKNEKIHDRFEFPALLNLKPFCEEDNNMYPPRESSYYEYNLVGVIVHKGPADSGDYFSLISTTRGGTENVGEYNMNDISHVNSWYKFNDSSVSKVKYSFDLLAAECYGRKENTANSNNEQSAYMLVYERKIKFPLKMKVLNDDVKTEEEKIITFGTEEKEQIFAEYDLFRCIDADEYANKKQKLFSSLFYDKDNNEYFRYLPFYFQDKLLSSQYYIEIQQDNSQLHGTFENESSSLFYEEVATILNDTLKSQPMPHETAVSISLTLADFLINIFRKKDRIPLQKPVKIQLIDMVKSHPSCLGSIWEYFKAHKDQITEMIFNENDSIVSVNCELLLDLVAILYEIDKKKFIEAIEYQNEDNSVYDNCFKIILFLISKFKEIPSKLWSKVGPVMRLIRRISMIDESILLFLGKHEVVFSFATFFLSQKSFQYDEQETPPKITGYEPIVELIYEIFCKSTWRNNINSKGLIELTDRDIKCITSYEFLSFIFKSSANIFSSLLVKLSKDDYNFTLTLCNEIVKSIGQICYFSDVTDFPQLTSAILPLLTLKDEYQAMRFEILLGIPQFIMEDRVRYPFSLVGYHKMVDKSSKIVYCPSSRNVKNCSSILNKIFELHNKKEVVIQVLLLLFASFLENDELLKYFMCIPSEEIEYENIIQWGIAVINTEGKSDENANRSKLKEILVELIPRMNLHIEDHSVLLGMRYIIKDIKREEIRLIEAKENVYIYVEEYFANGIVIKNCDEICIDFSKSKSYPKVSLMKQRVEDGEKTEAEEIAKEDDNDLLRGTEGTLILGPEFKTHLSEKEFYKLMLPQWSSYSKIIVADKYPVPGYQSILRRFQVLNISGKDAIVGIQIQNDTKAEDLNVYIPMSPITAFCGSNSVRNLFSMAKKSLDHPWTDLKDYSYITSIEFI